MKRFVTYLYEYERGAKTKNTGFIRVDIRERFVNMEICIRKFLRGENEGDVYALVMRRGLYGIELGKIQIQNGQGDLRLQWVAKSLQDTEFTIEDVVGIGICFTKQSYLASCWKDAYAEGIGNSAFSIWKKSVARTEKIEKAVEVVEDASKLSTNLEQKEKIVESEGIFEEETTFHSTETDSAEKCVMPETTDTEESLEPPQEALPNKESRSTFQTNLYSPQIALGVSTTQMKSLVAQDTTPFTSKYSMNLNQKQEVCEKEDVDSLEKNSSYHYKKIDLLQISDISGQNFHYERNAFLIHGFWNYGYLVLKTEVEKKKKTISLGVPGVYELPEATMALVFGFPKFETFPKEIMEMPISKEMAFTKEEIEKNQQPKEKTFGCWFVELSI